MKITCACGALLADNTDFISFKAHLVADQDYFDYLDALPRREQRQYQRVVYQCYDCGRLLLQNRAGDQHRYTFFTPDDAEAAKGALRSNLGSRWRGFLYGDEGEIWWYFGDGESGSERFRSWEEVERRYRALFEQFRARGILRQASLKKDGQAVHHWSSEE
ncbi:MAG TPA: hypothetical protein VEO54_03840 [Thermoanaerobaculia bacterium]|nr:hypothetical protein [Thermoanaerobaculia bacterium]